MTFLLNHNNPMTRIIRWTFALLILFRITGYGQGENNVWTFGNHNGLNFNSGTPVFFQSSNVSLEGSASVSDAGGNLIFYSNGNTVWNASGAAMPNGTGLLGNGLGMGIPGSCAQGVAIVRSVANNSQYYVFTLDAAEDVSGGVNAPGYLRYSVVDMSLNGGNGDVLPALKNIHLDTFMSEKMMVTRGPGCSYWLVAHRNNSNMYRAFKIDAAGIHPAVTSTGLWGGDMGGGQMKISPDGTRIALGTTLTGSGLEVANFDINTGQVSNAVTVGLSAFSSYYGVSFSPDNSKLYAATFGGTLYQYDLSLMPNTAAMEAARYTVASGYQFSSMRAGPDQKIYIAIYQNTPFIASINNPNLGGAACNFNLNALPQPASAQFTSLFGNPYGHGLGNEVVMLGPSDTLVHPTHDSVACLEDSVKITAPPGANSYTWNDGYTGQTRYVSQSGRYWVYAYYDCSVEIDTFSLALTDISLDLGPDTTICSNGSLALDAAVPGATYRWQDGSTDPGYTVTEAGTYSVRITVNDCSSTDTIKVGSFNPYLKIREKDTLLCDDASIVLHAEASPESSFSWNNGGSQGPERLVTEAGLYVVTAANACGTYTDSVRIAMEDCSCKAFLPNAFTPNGDQHNDVYKARISCQVSNFTLSVYNRYGQRIFQGNTPDSGWDGTFNGAPADVGTYFFYLRYKGPRGDTFERKGDLVLLR